MRIGLYPGTFDPVTLGHTDIIQRAMALVDRLVIGVAINRDKGPLFTLEERVAMVEAECAASSAENRRRDRGPSVREPADRLRPRRGRIGHRRGPAGGGGFRVRIPDGRHEPRARQQHRDGVPDGRCPRQAIASKLVKEIARLGGDVSKFVTPPVQAALVAKYA
jgi:pantetheine-phosphate adenylyltransferase